jgi:hypothetical protein
MLKEPVKKIQTDADVKRKAVKLVISHLKKKVPKDFIGAKHLSEWIEDIENLLSKPDFVMKEYIEMRKSFTDVIESSPDEEIRFKLRDSWFSMGKALDKKVKQKY